MRQRGSELPWPPPADITLPKDQKADPTLESEMGPDCTIHGLGTPSETENKSHHILVTES